MPQKFRKKPVVIEAEHFTDPANLPAGVHVDPTSPTGFGIFTLEHTVRAHEVTLGDWIITGVVGEKYACKADIFDMTYEAVTA